ncbi:hypothetical protein [Fodinibius halophilus]|uniref:Porin family protein n=1 Tax=Fodinibius halophilus TaxID=1736908 RepID=A0A6M1T0L0_9BACT|nr:hypothetical protein [Fodinibius halophilus]NGP87469.1 hypothetical protein [Fodinibius halophilus]
MFRDKKVFFSNVLTLCGFLLCTLMITPTVYSQETDDVEITGSMKISGISPMVGANFNFGENNTIRTLGFFHVNRSGVRDNFFLDVSYLRKFGLTDTEDVNTYWGINLHLQFEDPTIGPGAIFGTSYSLSEHFAIFGEAGLNVFILDDSGFGGFGMLNSGLGIEVKF